MFPNINIQYSGTCLIS